MNVVYGEGAGLAGTDFPGVTVEVKAAETAKCSRCWTHDGHVGTNAEHPELCPRCAEVVSKM